MNTLQELPVGIQDFNTIRRDNFVYVDKTKYIYQLAKKKYYFLSRPRRFGKSLLVSTLEAFFKAKKELFKGLWIENSDWQWQEYPVIRFDMGAMRYDSLEALESTLIDEMQHLANNYGVNLEIKQGADQTLKALIKQLSAKGQVIALIDEYDKPMLDNILKLDYAQEIRDLLRGFYGILKAEDTHLKFVFFTGVTKFSKTSVFSGLNNPEDLSMLDDYAAMLGITESEIDNYFVPHIEYMAEHMGKSYDELRVDLRTWYNGYRMAKRVSEENSVYNPYSLISALSGKDIRGYWFSTGTPTFLIKTIRQKQFDLIELEHMQASESSFDEFEINNLAVLPLLYQTGYLTIADYREDVSLYKFKFPNREVNLAFTQTLLNQFCDNQSEMCGIKLVDMLDAFLKDDFEAFLQGMNELLEYVPHDLYIKQEKHYHSLFFLIIKLMGLTINAEVHTHKGRIDAVIVKDYRAYIFEFKLNQSAQAAIQQIKDKKYYQEYENTNKQIYLFGINFNSEKRLMDDWTYELLMQKLYL